MKLRYDNTKSDLIWGQCQMMGFNRAFRYFVAVLTVVFLYSGFTYSGVQNETVGFRVCYAVVYSCFALGIGLLGALSVTTLNILLGKGKGLIGEHQLVITDEGLEESTAYNRSLNRWDGMRGIKETSSFYFLYVTDNTAHLVPKKKALLEGDLHGFIAEARERMAVPALPAVGKG